MRELLGEVVGAPERERARCADAVIEAVRESAGESSLPDEIGDDEITEGLRDISFVLIGTASVLERAAEQGVTNAAPMRELVRSAATVAYTIRKLHERRVASRNELGEALRRILWPDGDGEHEWGSDTLNRVAEACERAGLKP